MQDFRLSNTLLMCTEMEPSRLAVMALVTNMSPGLASSVTSLLGSSFGAEFVRQNKGWNDDPHERFIGYGSNSSTSTSSNGMELGVRRQLIDFPDDAIMGFYFKLVVPYWSLPKVCKYSLSIKILMINWILMLFVF